MDEVLAEFSRLLRRRLELGTFTTEDAVRYTFFYALLSKGRVQPHEIILEWPHPNIARTQIDTYVASSSGMSLAIEFKYDREIPSGQAIPKPQNAGELFKDMDWLVRIADYPSMRRILVYLANRLMVTYFSNAENGHTSFFGLGKGTRLRVDDSYLIGKPATFVKSLGVQPRFQLECLWSESMPKQHELRVYEVVHL